MAVSGDPSEASQGGAVAPKMGNQNATFPSDALILLPARKAVLFPGLIVPLMIGREKSVAAVQQAVREQHQIGVVLQRDAAADDPGPDGVYRIGTLANIVRYITMPDGTHHVILQGVQRIRILDFIPGTPFPVARVAHIPETEARSPEIEARFRNLQSQALEAMQLLPQAPQELIAAIQEATSAGALADLAAGYMDIPAEQKQEILETVDLVTRIDRVSRLLAERIEVMRLTQEIGKQTKAALDERQREAVLREQMAAIQRQLGEGDVKTEEVRELNEAIAKAHMPREQARKELKRYERMPDAAAETGMIRTYLDWLSELPWQLPEEKPIDIAVARRILDEDHFGLKKIKRRVLEYLAVRKLAPQGKAPILRFVGPPGVGKTSLGQSIARYGPPIRSRQSWRCSRRGGDSRSSSNLHRRSAG